MSLLTPFPYQGNKNVYVKYECSCGESSDISFLYYCQHCMKLDCHYCVHHSIDSYYCKKCLDTLVFSDTKKYNYSCKQCFECPRCFHILTSITPQRPTAPSTIVSNDSRLPQPLNILLTCMNCKWSSADLELGEKQITEYISLPAKITDKMKGLIAYYKTLSSMDAKHFLTMKNLTNKKLAPKNPSLFNTRQMLEQKARMIGYSLDTKFKLGYKTSEQESNVKVCLPEEFVSIATDSLPSVPDSFYNEPANLNEITTFKQRLNDPLLQPKFVNQLKPKFLLVTTKRFKRCSECQHILAKADIKVTVKFKIHSIAYSFIPILTINKLPEFKVNTTTNVLVTISNYSMKSISLKIKSDPNPLINVRYPTCSIELVEIGDGISYDILDVDSSMPEHNLVYSNYGHIAQVYFEITPSEGCKEISFPVYLKYHYLELENPNNSLTTSTPNSNRTTSEKNESETTHTLHLTLNLGTLS